MAHLLTSLLVALLAATLAAWFAAVLHERGLHPLRRLASAVSARPPCQALILAAVALGMIHHGATKTNGVPDRAGGEALRGGALPVESPAASTNADWLAFGACDDWFRVATEGWCFRFGTGLVESVTVLACGEIRAATADASNRISVLGVPLSVLPAAGRDAAGGAESLFWHAETPSNTLLLAWMNALAWRDTNALVSVVAELSRDGAASFRYDFSAVADVSALANAAAKVWRDGTEECVPLMTGAVVAVDFAAPPVTGTNALDEVYARMAGGNSNAYYFAEVAVERGPARIRVRAAGESTLGGYEFMAEPGATNRLPLLIGERYEVSGETAFEHFALEEPEMQTEASFPSATNLTDRLVAVEWPLKFALEEVAAGAEAVAYIVRVTPNGLGGEFVWGGVTNGSMRGVAGARSAGGCTACGTPPVRSGGGGCGCGCTWVDGETVWHSSSCECDDCELEGCYRYEGRVECFELPFDEGGDEPSGGDDGGGDDPPEPPDPPSVSVAFEDSVVIFEDAYENSPGVTVPRQSTRTKLTLTAHGGDDGCTFTLNVSGKLQRVPGSSSPPSSVSPGEDIEWSAYYEGVSASAQMNDATASATYTNLRTGETGNTGNITATVVEIELHPKLLVNNCPHRHMVGVCETVDCLHNPASFPIEWDATGDGMIIEENGLPVFVASVSGNSAQLSVANGGNPFFSNLPIVEPTGLLCSNQIIVVTNSVPQGVAGGIGMKLHLYVTPLTVSFANIAVEEVPCSTGNHSGYFANPAFAGCWSHTYAMGAGRWHDIQSGNYFGQDTSTSGDWPAPWSDGTMTWNIPIGWSYGETTNGDPEKNFPVQYLSAWTMDAEGTVSKSKHGHSVSRTTNDVVRLDGVIQ